MKLSAQPGTNTIAVEVTEINNQGITLRVENRHLFIPYAEFPWFEGQPAHKVKNVVEPSPGRFHWPDLDVDLSENIINHPERYPLRFDPINV